MKYSDKINGAGYVKCRIYLEAGEEYDAEAIYRACDPYYTPILGGMIQPYGRDAYNVTVYTD